MMIHAEVHTLLYYIPAVCRGVVQVRVGDRMEEVDKWEEEEGEVGSASPSHGLL